MITRSGIEGLLRKRLQTGYNLTSEDKAKIDEYLKAKEELASKQGQFKDTDVSIELTNMKTMLYFLLKEDLSDYQLPSTIHPAGCIKQGFVIEPINSHLFIYNWCGLKGFTQPRTFPETKKYYVVIEDEEIMMERAPLKSFLYELPDERVLSDWIKDKVTAPEPSVLYDQIDAYLRYFLDLGDDSYYHLLNYFIWQSWLAETLRSVFYISIVGAFGGGKTTAGEITIKPCKHGYFVANASESFMARSIDSQKFTLFLDELDSTFNSSEDNCLYSLIRQGYRKGAKFSRINDEMQPECFNVYGPKIFTIHTGIEEALQTRSFPVTIVESEVAQFSIRNMMQGNQVKSLLNDLYLYYIHNIIIIIDQVTIVTHLLNSPSTSHSLEKSDSLDTPPSHPENNATTWATRELKGRDAELAINLILIGQLIEIPIGQPFLEELFRNKKLIEEDRIDIGPLAILRVIIIKLYDSYHTNKDYVMKDGCFKVSNKEVYDKFLSKMKNEKYEFGAISPHKFSGYLRELGFERPSSRAKAKIPNPDNVSEQATLLCNIYTQKVMRKLGLKWEDLSEQFEQEKLVKESD